MRKFGSPPILLVLVLMLCQCRREHSELVVPTMDELYSGFVAPHAGYGPTLLWGWEGPVTREVIIHDLDRIRSLNLRSVTIEAGYNMTQPYLSPGWFGLISFAVEQAKQRGMVVWLIDEGKYPSGFAGGKFSRERPDLTMQGLDIFSRAIVEEGDTLDRLLPESALSAVAMNLADSTYRILDVSRGSLRWIVPAGKWRVIITGHRFRTSVTRAANNPTRGKDTVNALCDYLNPEATKQFISFTHEQYRSVLGNEFGQTVLGFRGDEPDYGFIPWTPRLPDLFLEKKGYDVRPYLAAFFMPRPDGETRRIKADYWDVWSQMFGENYFRVIADWCGANNLSYMVHMNHEDQMVALARSGGDFFGNLRHVQIPGVDAIWNQIWPDRVADFPKYASSVAHLCGRPFVLSESFAAYRIPPDLKQAKWVIDHQFARGINLFEFMFWASSASGFENPRGWMADSLFPDVVNYTNRVSCLLSMGKPAAPIAVYYPTTSLWLGQREADRNVLKLMQEMLEHQVDFDFVDEYALTEVLEINGREMVNLSDQAYSALIVPSCLAISGKALKKLEQFSASGGKLFFLGQPPSLLVDTTFRYAKSLAGIPFGINIPCEGFSSELEAELPGPDLALDGYFPAVKYIHRIMKDGDLYFIFNEGDQPLSFKATLAGNGNVQIWNAMTGDIEEAEGSFVTKNQTGITLHMAPWETKVVVLRNLPPALKQ